MKQIGTATLTLFWEDEGFQFATNFELKLSVPFFFKETVLMQCTSMSGSPFNNDLLLPMLKQFLQGEKEMSIEIRRRDSSTKAIIDDLASFFSEYIQPRTRFNLIVRLEEGGEFAKRHIIHQDKTETVVKPYWHDAMLVSEPEEEYEIESEEEEEEEEEQEVEESDNEMEEEDSEQGLAGIDPPPPTSVPLKYVSVKVYYGTNRNFCKEELPENAYDNRRADRIQYGSCEVSIPKDHVEGTIDRSSWLRRLLFKPSPTRDMMVLSVTQSDEEDFFKELRAAVLDEEPDDSDVLLFVHGYNVDFGESIKRTAQLSYDLRFPGPAIAYSWPSRGKVAGYFGDEASVNPSTFYFKQFLLALIEKTGTKKLHIIAHSMGNRIVTAAIKEFADKGIQFQTVIRHVILAAPDIDADDFKLQIAPAFNGLHRVTLYASSNDKALLASMEVHSEYKRAGQGGKNICIVSGVDTVDASSVSTDLLGHGYFASTKALIDDIHMLIRNDLPPDRRVLEKVPIVPLPYWMFPNTK